MNLSLLLQTKGITFKENYYRSKFDWDANGNPIYVGYAPRGLDTSSAEWIISKIVWDANGNPTDILMSVPGQIWDNRTSVVYG